MWIAEEASTAMSLVFRHDIRCLEDQIHALQLDLEQSKASEVSVRREASEQKARIEPDAQLNARRIHDNFQRESAQY